MAVADRGDEYTPYTSVLEDETPAPESEVKAQVADNPEPEGAEEGAEEGVEDKGDDKGDDKGNDKEKVRDDKGRFIPKSRFDDAVRKEREGRELAERRLGELQAQLKQNQRQVDTGELETQIKGLEKQYTKLVLQGDEDAASEIMGQIRLKERTVAIQEATHLSAQAKDQAREEIRVDAAIERIEASYPELREGADEYDQDIVDMVLAAQQANINDRRMTPSMALVKATEVVMSKIARKSAPEPEKKGLAAAAGAADRKAAQVEKNIAAARAQPPSTKSVGEDSDKAGVSAKVDVAKLTREEFAALPEATRARLRGDFYEGAEA